jgi:ketosteroid isomerase-like protein
MNAMQAKKTVRRFIDRINAQDVDGLYNLMTEDHRIVDALGEVVQGRDTMRVAWGIYFRMDYN